MVTEKDRERHKASWLFHFKKVYIEISRTVLGVAGVDLVYVNIILQALYTVCSYL